MDNGDSKDTIKSKEKQQKRKDNIIRPKMDYEYLGLTKKEYEEYKANIEAEYT